MPLGDVASIRMGGVEAVLITTRAQAMGTDLFSNFSASIPKQTQNSCGEVRPSTSTRRSRKSRRDTLYAEGDGALPRDVRKLP